MTRLTLIIPALVALLVSGPAWGVRFRVLNIAFLISLLAATSASLAYANPCPDGLRMQQYRQQLYDFKLTAIANMGLPGSKEYLEARSRVSRLTAKFPQVWLDQEIRNFPLAVDARCLLGAMRTASGLDLSLQSRTDGKLNLLRDGQVIREGISAADLLSIAKSLR
jgi:hypothetical protein